MGHKYFLSLQVILGNLAVSGFRTYEQMCALGREAREALRQGLLWDFLMYATVPLFQELSV